MRRVITAGRSHVAAVEDLHMRTSEAAARRTGRPWYQAAAPPRGHENGHGRGAAETDTKRREESRRRSSMSERPGDTTQAQAIDRLADLVGRLEGQTAPWVLGWSRERWQGLLVGVLLTLVLVVVGLVGYWRFGPPSTLQAELVLYRHLWAVTTEAERERIHSRLRSGTPSP